MGSVTTNKRSVELQLMRKLMLSRCLHMIHLEEDKQYEDHFQDLLRNSDTDNVTDHSMHDTHMSTTCSFDSGNWSQLSDVVLPNHYKLKSLEISDLEILLEVYQALYKTNEISLGALAENIQSVSICNNWECAVWICHGTLFSEIFKNLCFLANFGWRS